MRKNSENPKVLQSVVSSRERGVLKTWNDGKGFGFIKSAKEEAPEIFIHVSGIRNRIPRRPQPGDVVYYQIMRDERTGKSRACDVHLVCAFEVDEKSEISRNSDNRIESWIFCMANGSERRSLDERYTPPNVGGCVSPTRVSFTRGSASRQLCEAWQV